MLVQSTPLEKSHLPIIATMHTLRSALIDTGLYRWIAIHYLSVEERIKLWAAFPGIDLANLVAERVDSSPIAQRFRTTRKLYYCEVLSFAVCSLQNQKRVLYPNTK